MLRRAEQKTEIEEMRAADSCSRTGRTGLVAYEENTRETRLARRMNTERERNK
jgi:hypothetical protein